LRKAARIDGSLMMLALTPGAFLLATWVATKGALLLSAGIAHPLRATVEEFAALKAANPDEEATDRATVARPTTDQRARQVRRKPLAVAQRMPACLRRAGKGGKQIDAVADLGEQNVR
jgi:hypothetical protein